MNLEKWLLVYPYAYEYKNKRLFSIFGFEFRMIFRDLQIFYIIPSLKIYLRKLLRMFHVKHSVPLTTNLYMGNYYYKEPQRYFQGGKRKLFTNKRDIEEYAKRNDLMYGGTDLDQETEHKRKQRQERLEDETAETITQAILNKNVARNLLQ